MVINLVDIVLIDLVAVVSVLQYQINMYILSKFLF